MISELLSTWEKYDFAWEILFKFIIYYLVKLGSFTLFWYGYRP